MIERGKSPRDFQHCGGYSHSVIKVGLCETGRPRNVQMSC